MLYNLCFYLFSLFIILFYLLVILLKAFEVSLPNRRDSLNGLSAPFRLIERAVVHSEGAVGDERRDRRQHQPQVVSRNSSHEVKVHVEAIGKVGSDARGEDGVDCSACVHAPHHAERLLEKNAAVHFPNLDDELVHHCVELGRRCSKRVDARVTT